MSLLVADNLGKAYRSYRSEWQRFASWLYLPVKPLEEHWVLRGVSFSIQPGEAVGILGQNGAGKSTLLKMLVGTLQPTVGRVALGGRIAAILELGMGFDPELSGRQNVRHSAGLMGFTAHQVEQVMAEIQAFAEIGDYFDLPVRTYSSGMQVRVAFSVATAFRPDILVVDEALSVGDSAFQHKCFDRIRDFQRQGTALLFVSHDRGAIQALCSRAILLDSGRVVKDGDPEDVMDFYNAIVAERESDATLQVRELDNGKVQVTSGTGEACFTEWALYNGAGEPIEVLTVGTPVELRVEVRVQTDIPSLVFGYSIKDRLGQVMYGTNTWHTRQVIEQPQAGTVYRFAVGFMANLGVGSYSVQLALHDGRTHLTRNYQWLNHALVFSVVNPSGTEFDGSCWLPPKIQVQTP